MSSRRRVPLKHQNKVAWKPNADRKINETAAFDYLLKTYGFLTPEFWRETRFTKSPFQEYTDLLMKPSGKELILEEDKVDA